MLFVVAKILEIIASPDNGLLLLLLLGVALLWLGRGLRLGRALVTAVALMLLAVSVLPLGRWAILPLERRFPPQPLPDRVDGIILLGGAINLGQTAPYGQVALNGAAERLTETVALARRYPAVPIVLSGASGSLFPGRLTEAEAMRRVLAADGVDNNRLLLENHSRDTFENAVDSKALVDPRDGQVWLLVTSAFHMPRAVGCFRHVGWEVVPVPVDYREGPRRWIQIPALAANLHLVKFALHEWVGLVGYRLLGRIDSIFPAPTLR